MARTGVGQAEVGIYTYGKKTTTTPPTTAYVIDVCGLRDPQASGDMRRANGDGRTIACQQYVKQDKRVEAIVDQIKLLAHMHKRSSAADQKWLSFAIADHHGRYLAPAIGELAANALSNMGFKVSCWHTELETATEAQK